MKKLEHSQNKYKQTRIFKLWYSRVENSAINIYLMVFASNHDCDCLYRPNSENHLRWKNVAIGRNYQ